MSSLTPKQAWEQNANLWIELSRQGYDVYRDYVNTPAFLEALPPLSGLSGLDIACGEGSNTRALARKGARITGLDASPTFLQAARNQEESEALGIHYVHGDATATPFASDSFDFATAIMSLMDIETPEQAIAEAYRILKPGGFFQFSIMHPCFIGNWLGKWTNDEQGNKVALEVKDYFVKQDGQDPIHWLFGNAPQSYHDEGKRFIIPRFHRTLSEWINACLQQGFQLELLVEPRASDELVAKMPRLGSTQVVAHFLIARFIKPDTSTAEWHVASNEC